jgi:hypothetical protein
MPIREIGSFGGGLIAALLLDLEMRMRMGVRQTRESRGQAFVGERG